MIQNETEADVRNLDAELVISHDVARKSNRPLSFVGFQCLN